MAGAAAAGHARGEPVDGDVEGHPTGYRGGASAGRRAAALFGLAAAVAQYRWTLDGELHGGDSVGLGFRVAVQCESGHRLGTFKTVVVQAALS